MRFLMLTATAAWLAAVSASGAILAGDKNIGSIWCIGDSIMQSVADGDGNSSPRKSLYNLLNAGGYDFSYTGSWETNHDGLPDSGGNALTNKWQYHDGHSGWQINSFTKGSSNADDLSNLWNNGRLQYVKPSVIIIMLGTNDINNYNYLGSSAAAGAQAAHDRMITFLDKLYALPGVGAPTVILSTIPPNKTTDHNADRGDVQFRTDATILFNSLLSDIVNEYQTAGRSIYLSDAYTLLNNEYSLSMRGDNLHTNTYGNDLLAQAWFDTINGLVIPEPSTWALMLGGGAALLAFARKKNCR